MSDGKSTTQNQENQEPKEHYVCTGGCGTVRFAPKRCVIPGCPRNRNPLTRCYCTDDEHAELKNRNNPAAREGDTETK